VYLLSILLTLIRELLFLVCLVWRSQQLLCRRLREVVRHA